MNHRFEYESQFLIEITDQDTNHSTKYESQFWIQITDFYPDLGFVSRSMICTQSLKCVSRSMIQSRSRIVYKSRTRIHNYRIFIQSFKICFYIRFQIFDSYPDLGSVSRTRIHIQSTIYIQIQEIYTDFENSSIQIFMINIQILFRPS